MQVNYEVLRENCETLVLSLDAQALSHSLFTRGVITLQLYEKLSPLAHTTRTEKNGILFQDLVRNTSPNLIPQLCEVLDAEEATRHLAVQLKGFKPLLMILYTVFFLKTL